MRCVRIHSWGMPHCRCAVTKRGSWQMEDCLHWVDTYIHLAMFLLPDLDERITKAWRLLCHATCHFMRATHADHPRYPYTADKRQSARLP